MQTYFRIADIPCEPYRAGIFEKSAPRPSAIVGCAMIESHFEKGTLELPKLEGTAHRSRSWQTTPVSFEESPPGSSLDWHRAPARQYVITLSGTLEFETRLGEKFALAPGTILLAEDIKGDCDGFLAKKGGRADAVNRGAGGGRGR